MPTSPTPLWQLQQHAKPLLADDSTFGAQRDAVHQLHGLYVSLGAVDAYEPALAAHETLLPQGLALGPVRAAQASLDFLRTRVLLRGLRAALQQTLQHQAGPIHVLYAGCGPYAALALPLMSLFEPDVVRWTLLDLHVPSVASARTLLEAFGLMDRVERLLAADGCAFEWDGRAPLSGVVAEAMNNALCTEPHVGLMAHLAPQLAPGGFLVPSVVEVDAVLAHTQRQSQLGLTGSVPPDWLQHLGRVATLDVDTARQGRAAVLHGLSGVLPPRPAQGEFCLELHTRVLAWPGHALESTQCGITLPKVLARPRDIPWGTHFSVEYAVDGPPTVRLVRGA